MKKIKAVILGMVILEYAVLPETALSAVSAAEPAAVALEKFESPEGKFSVSIPAGWAREDRFPYRKIDDTVNGVMLRGPLNKDGAAVKIAVLHYAGQGIQSAERYINRVLSNFTRLDAETKTEFSEVEVAGKKGKTFTFTRFELINLPFEPLPMKEGLVYEIVPPSKQVTMLDRYIVIPAAPGFYSLWYEVPEDIYEEYACVFDAVVKSFACQQK